MCVRVHALCVCAKARGRHWVLGCTTLCLIHVRQCLSLNLCSLVLARLAGQQAPGISVPHHPSTAGAGAGGNACHVCWCSGSKAGDHTCSARALTHWPISAAGKCILTSSLQELLLLMLVLWLWLLRSACLSFLFFPFSQFPQVHRHLENYKAN